MGTFANVPKSKYGNLSPEDKAKVDAYRNQDYDVDVQGEQGGNYADVISREDSKAVDAPAKKAAPKNK